MSKVKILVGSSYTSKTILESSVKKEGDRAVDQIQFAIPKNEFIATNDKVYYVQDFATLDDLSLILNFQSNVKDESGNFNHGTATSITYADSDFYGKHSIFNGSSSFISVPDNNSLDLAGEFDIFLWAKWTATGAGFLLSKRSSGTTGFALSVNASSAGDVKFHIGSSTITSSSAGFNDGNKHLIRITRDSSNLVTLYVDGVSKGTATVATDLSNSSALLVGKDYGGTFFNGNMIRLRIYKGSILADVHSTLILNKINPRSTIKFGGYATKIENDLISKKITAQSFGKILAEKEVRGNSFANKTPEFILNDLVTTNTNLTFDYRDTATGLTVERFLADGKLYDIIRDFAAYTNRIFYTTPMEELVFEPVNFTTIQNTYSHGTDNVIISNNGFDDSRLVNSLTVIGEIQKFNTSETFTGDGNDKTFSLNFVPVTARVSVAGTEKVPNVDYEIDTLTKILEFTTAPANSASIVIDYDYEIPLVVRGERPSSISQYGVHSKKLTLSWLSDRTDTVRFIQSYLNKYNTIQQRIVLNFGAHVNYIQENDVINVSSPSIGVSGDFVVKSITWTYPTFMTTIEVGEYYFDYFEDDKEIVRKLHDYEAALMQQKDLQDYESPEEVLGLTATATETVSAIFSESLSMADADNIYEKTVATWGSSNYGSRITQNVYGSSS